MDVAEDGASDRPATPTPAPVTPTKGSKRYALPGKQETPRAGQLAPQPKDSRPARCWRKCWRQLPTWKRKWARRYQPWLRR